MDFKIMLIGQFFLANQKCLKWTNEERAFLNPRLNNLIFLRHICIDLVNIQDCSSIFVDQDTVDPDFVDFYKFHQKDVQLVVQPIVQLVIQIVVHSTSHFTAVETGCRGKTILGICIILHPHWSNTYFV